MYASRGYAVYYVCATRGEAGTVDAEHLKGFKDTAEMRTDELMRAGKELGLKEIFFLGYRDSGMPGMEDNKHPDAQINAPIDEVAGRVVKYIRDLKPEVVLTFDPIGGYKHPDHIHIHKATVLAFDYVQPPPDVRQALRLGEGEAAQRVVRVRSRDDLPVVHLVTYVPEAIGRTFTRADMERLPLYALLRRAGHGYCRADQRIGAALADPSIAGLLAVDVGAPLLQIRRLLCDAGGRPVEDLTMLAPPDRYQLRTLHNWQDPDRGPLVSYETTLGE